MTETRRAATVAAWWPWLALPAAASSLVAVGLVLAAVQHRHLEADEWSNPALAIGFTTVATGIWATGPVSRGLRVLAALYLTIGLSASLSLASYGWAMQDLPGAETAGWVAEWVWAFGFAPAVCFAVVLHPDGRLPGRRWWPVPALGAVGVAGFFLSAVLRTGDLEALPTTQNPTGVLSSSQADALALVAFLIAMGAGIGGVVALTVKYRRAPRQGEVRGQIGPFALAAGLYVITLAALSARRDAASSLLIFTLAAALPATVALAVLRHNLLDPADEVAALTRQLRRARDARADLARERALERARLRRELHDGLGPSLAAIGLGLRKAESDVDLTEIRALGDEVQRAVVEIRRICDGLQPAALAEVGLVEALTSAVEPLRSSGVAIDVTAEPLPAAGPAMESAAFRIAMEATTNAVRHSGADRIVVHLAGDHGILLTVTDDGSGIPESARTGVGTTTMRDRAEELGGSLVVAPAEGGGTSVRAWLPEAGDG